MRELILALIEGNANTAVVEMAFYPRTIADVERNHAMFKAAYAEANGFNRYTIRQVMLGRLPRAKAINTELRLRHSQPSVVLLVLLFTWPGKD